MPLTRLNDSAFDPQLEGIYFGMWNGSSYSLEAEYRTEDAIAVLKRSLSIQATVESAIDAPARVGQRPVRSRSLSSAVVSRPTSHGSIRRVLIVRRR